MREYNEESMHVIAVNKKVLCNFNDKVKKQDACGYLGIKIVKP